MRFLRFYGGRASTAEFCGERHEAHTRCFCERGHLDFVNYGSPRPLEFASGSWRAGSCTGPFPSKPFRAAAGRSPLPLAPPEAHHPPLPAAGLVCRRHHRTPCFTWRISSHKTRVRLEILESGYFQRRPCCGNPPGPIFSKKTPKTSIPSTSSRTASVQTRPRAIGANA